MMGMRRWIVGMLGLLWLGAACTPAPAGSTAVVIPPTVPRAILNPTPTFSHTATLLPPPSLPTAVSTATYTATPTPSPTPTQTPTPTPVPVCSERMPQPGDLLTVVTLTYPISRSYAPDDLVLLTDYLPLSVTKGYPTEIRAIVLEPLLTMLAEMQSVGLQPHIISGYRSYAAQAQAYQKWLAREPERVNQLSAPPGHSEHQLGTTLDFSSPQLSEIVGEAEIEFHTYFYQTREGSWLLENAHRYGFTLSYPRAAQGVTGFTYEPWHYRYVGVEVATLLKEQGLSLTEYQLAGGLPPCELE